jgi:hypothetical protein
MSAPESVGDDGGSGSICPGQSRKEHVRAGVGYHAQVFPPV